jgi:DNA-binding CsgD family transcriptional regulator
MPCTNNTDYSRVAGTTFLGRRNQQEAQRKIIRTIVTREIGKQSQKPKIGKKSLFSELTETKTIGKRIGRAVSPGSLSRRMRRSIEKIEGVLNPLERRDMDNDGFIFDGTWREMRKPVEAAGGLASRVTEEPPLWASKVNNRRWMTAKKIKKGGTLKASELLNFDRLRLRRDRYEQARVLGVDKSVIDAMHEPDASIDPFDADRLTMSALDLHPALIWGEAWLEADKKPSKGKPDKRIGRTNLRKPLDDRDKRVLAMRRDGKSLQAIADELGISKERARQIVARAKLRNEQNTDKGFRSSTNNPKSTDVEITPGRQPGEPPLKIEPGTELRVDDPAPPLPEPALKRGDGMIPRDARGKPIRERDARQETLERTIEKLKSLGFSDEEINLLMTGNKDTPVDTKTRDVDTSAAKRGGFSSRTTGLSSMSLSEMANSESSTWPKNQKTHIVDWGNSRPSFNVPYALAQKFKTNGDLSDKEWKRLLKFYTRFGPESRGMRSSTLTNLTNVGAKRMSQIILDRVKPENRGKRPGKRTHYHVVGAGAMGKSTLLDYLVKEKIIPTDDKAAHVDPDFIKQGLIGYNGGSGAVAVHRESAQTATKTVNLAAKEGMDIVTEGTGYRLYEYSTTSDSSYKKVVHIPYLPFEEAEKRLKKRNSQGGRQLPVSQIRLKGQQMYGWLVDHIQRNEIQNMYIWDMNVPEGAAPRVIAKIEDGVFRAIDEPTFKKWSEQSGGHRGGDSNLAWFKRNFPTK